MAPGQSSSFVGLKKENAALAGYLSVLQGLNISQFRLFSLSQVFAP